MATYPPTTSLVGYDLAVKSLINIPASQLRISVCKERSTHLSIVGVWMHKRTQRSSIDHQPGYKRTELSRGEEVDLEHANRMRTEWPVPNAVDAQFWEFMADAGPQFVGECALGFVFL